MTAGHRQDVADGLQRPNPPPAEIRRLLDRHESRSWSVTIRDANRLLYLRCREDAAVAVERPKHRAGELCGQVVWLRSPFDEGGCDLRDRHNPDPGLRNRKVTGLEIRGLKPRPDGTWVGGSIYDPATGNTYTCRLALDGADRLRLRGYVGIPLLGRTTTWTRVGAESRRCREDSR